MLTFAACSGGEEEVASGTFEDSEGGEGNYSVTEDDDGSTNATIKSADGEVRLSTGKDAVADMPHGLKLYPGAEIQSSLTGRSDEGAGSMISFKTSASPDEVIDFYRKQMEGAGITIENEVNSAGMKMIGGKAAKGGGVNLTVIEGGDGKVTATLLAGDG